MHEWLSPLIKFYPRDDRPELNRIVSVGGTLIATHAHVTLMSSSDVPSGHYSLTGDPIPVWKAYPLDKLFSYFSDMGKLAEVPLDSVEGKMTETHKGLWFRTRVEIGEVSIDPK